MFADHRFLQVKNMLIGYMRVSTDDQNLDLQSDALAKAGCEKVFRDKASGARDDRPGLAHALSHLREGDCLVVWKLDRLGRRMVSLIGFVEDLQRHGIGFRVLDGGYPIDTTTAQGKFFFHMTAALAEMERDLIRERTIAGLTAARARGRKGGRKPELSAKQIEHARTLLEDRHTTIKEVAETFGVSRGTIYRSLGLGKFGAANHIPIAPMPEERKPSSVPQGLTTRPDGQRLSGINHPGDIPVANYIKQLEQRIAEAQEQLDQARSH
jgi:DNA invertase Pin-like site-specific DNA recombinase